MNQNHKVESGNVYYCLEKVVKDEVLKAAPNTPDEVLARIDVGPSRNLALGEVSSNFALVAARAAGQSPSAFALAVSGAINALGLPATAQPAANNFVNFVAQPSWWVEELRTILRAGEAYGDSVTGAGTRINVEYVSANPTGPMHIGHCRGAVVGDALANLLAKAGYAVTKEYYINDAGAQVTALAWAAYWRYLQAVGTPLSEEDFRVAENSVSEIGSMSPSNSPPSAFRFLTKLSCSVWP